MLIREYAPNDKAAVITLLVQLQDHLVAVDDEKVQMLTVRYRKEYIDYLFDALRVNNGILLVAENAATIIGFVAGIIEPKDREDVLTNRCPIRGKVLELIVSKDFRLGGIGTALLQAMEEYFKKHKCEYICVDVFAPNEDAVRFYQINSYAPRNIEMYKRLGGKL